MTRDPSNPRPASTATDRRTELVELLRRRVLRGLAAGTVRAGDRLPSARELGGELGVDHRLVLDAYRRLADEGLVALRARGGIYVLGAPGGGVVPMPSAAWLAETLAEGVAREIPATELHEWLRRAVETVRLRAAAVQETADQIAGLCRELADEYGLDAAGVHVDELREGAVPAALRDADIVVTTPAFDALVRPVVERLGRTLVVVQIRPDLMSGDWRLLLQRPVWVVVRERAFVAPLRRFFDGIPGAENLRPLVVGEDDLGQIPEGAPVYVTRGARDALGDVPIRGRVLPAARLLSSDAAREVLRAIVRANLDALAAIRRPR